VRREDEGGRADEERASPALLLVPRAPGNAEGEEDEIEEGMGIW